MFLPRTRASLTQSPALLLHSPREVAYRQLTVALRNRACDVDSCSALSVLPSSASVVVLFTGAISSPSTFYSASHGPPSPLCYPHHVILQLSPDERDMKASNIQLSCSHWPVQDMILHHQHRIGGQGSGQIVADAGQALLRG